jgi:hypothetical protein
MSYRKNQIISLRVGMILIEIIVSCFFLIVLFSGSAFGQSKLDEISRLLKISNGYIGLRLTDGKEISGYAELDKYKQVMIIVQKSGESIEIPIDKINIKYITTYEQVLKAPITPPRIIVDLPPNTCCRNFNFYFAEIHLAVMKAKNIYFGAEAALGFNKDLFSGGFGAGLLSIHDAIQIPVYLHLKYYFDRKCLNPFLFLDIGYPFNSITSKYNVTFPTGGPISLGAGAGLDYSLNCFMDLSLGISYKYMKIAVEKEAPSCNKLLVLSYDEYHALFVTLGVTF